MLWAQIFPWTWLGSIWPRLVLVQKGPKNNFWSKSGTFADHLHHQCLNYEKCFDIFCSKRTWFPFAEESICFDWKPDQFIVVATQLMWIDIEAESSHISLLPPNSHRPQKCLGCSDMLHKDGATMLVHVSSHSFKSHNQTHIHDEIKHHWILYKGIIESLANYFLCTQHSDIVCRCETSWYGWELKK